MLSFSVTSTYDTKMIYLLYIKIESMIFIFNTEKSVTELSPFFS